MSRCLKQMNITSLVAFLVILFTIPPAATGFRRHRRMSFHFSMPEGGSQVDWEKASTVAMLDGHPTLPPNIWDQIAAGDVPNVNEKQTNNQDSNAKTDSTVMDVLTSATSRSSLEAPTAASVSPSVRQSNIAPLFRVDCLINQCLYFHGPCLPHQECVMNTDCTDIVCIDKNKPPSTPASRNIRQTFAATTHSPASVSPSVRQSNDAPIFRDDCLTNQCIYFHDSCLPHQECVMNIDCSDMVCIDKNKPPSTPATGKVRQTLSPTNDSPSARQSKDTPLFRDDCSPDKNQCNLLQVSCPSHQYCVMDTSCTGIICMDRNLKQTTTRVGNQDLNHTGTHPDSEASESNFRNDCPSDKDLCLKYSSACTSDEVCIMDKECRLMDCVKKNLLHDQNSTNDIFQAVVPATTRPTQNFKLCKYGYHKCINGYCKENECVCNKGWTGNMCNLPCTLDCQRGTCFLKLKKTFVAPEEVTGSMMHCNCHYGWTGDLCDTTYPDPAADAEAETVKLGASLGTVLFLVLILSIFTTIMLWRNRVILVMKLVYFFKLDESEDGRTYDAYISVGSATEGLEFVKDKLCPVLENSGFRLYIQARDQPIGEAVSDSILRTIKQSRRTIIVITPDYLKCEWSKFECIVAQMETLKLHQRIIPILLKDISAEKEDMGKTLKHIIDSVKCLKFPNVSERKDLSVKEKELLKTKKEEKFWKRVVLTMPKKKKALQSKGSEMKEHDVKNIKPINIIFHDMYTVV